MYGGARCRSRPADEADARAAGGQVPFGSVNAAARRGPGPRGFEDLGLHRIRTTCDPRNLGPAAERARHDTGRAPSSYRGWRDSDVFRILEDEWRKRW